MTEFHDWEDIRAELDDGDRDALGEERAGTEAWANAFHLAEVRRAEGLPSAGADVRTRRRNGRVRSAGWRSRP